MHIEDTAPAEAIGNLAAGVSHPENLKLAGEMKDRFDEYAALAIRIFERIIRDSGPGKPPLTTLDPSIRMEVERSKKQKPENVG